MAINGTLSMISARLMFVTLFIAPPGMPVMFPPILVLMLVASVMFPFIPVSIIPVSLLEVFTMSLVFTPVLIVIEIGPVPAHAEVNPVIIVNTNMAWKPSDMIPTPVVVMIVVTGSIIEVDTGRWIVIVVVPWLPVGNDGARIWCLIANTTTDIIGVIAARYGE